MTTLTRQRSILFAYDGGIVQAADHHDASVIVMGSHGAPASRALLGSVATAVSCHGDRPVLIVHAAAADRAA
jgi:nucleotide-binding universal stress UspA family protein